MKKTIFILCFCLLGLGFVYTPMDAKSYNIKACDQSIEVNNDTAKDISFNEMINEIATNEGKSYEEIENRFIANKRNWLLAQRSTNALAYTDEEILNMLSRSSYASDTVNIFSKNKKYAAGLVFYFSYIGAVPHRYIEQLLYVGINTNVSSVYKSFSGDVYVNLESDSIIHYIVNGAFYNTSVTTVGADVNIGVGGSANLHLGVSSSSSFYDGIYSEGRWYTSRY